MSTDLMMPPFCTLGSDSLPDGPVPGSDESRALAAWEVLTGARVARSTESGRMSRLGRYSAAGVELSPERVIWISLHPFEGADERWSCRRARRAAMTDDELASAIVQEMGGPAEDPDEMTTLGFWSGTVGFHFDCRGPAVVLTEVVSQPGSRAQRRTRRINRAALVRAARRILCIAVATSAPTPARDRGSDRISAAAPVEPPEQLSLL